MQWKLASCCCWRWWWMTVQDTKPEASRLHLSHHSVSFSVRRCVVHMHCELKKRLVYYPVCHQNIIRPHWTSFLTGRERRDASMTKTTMTSRSLSLQRQIRASLLTPQLIFGNSDTASYCLGPLVTSAYFEKKMLTQARYRMWQWALKIMY